MNTKKLVVSCCLVLGGVLAAACGATGPGGVDGLNGEAGPPGASVTGPQGPAGPSGDAGASVTGPQGVPGEVGPAGVGLVGEAGAQGAQGDAGSPGPIACGNALIPQGVWHSACNALSTPGYTPSGASVCNAGIVECRLTVQSADDAGNGELVPVVLCWDTVNNVAATVAASEAPQFDPSQPVAVAGTRCDEDLNCDGVADLTTGAGTNVALVRTALTFLCPVQSSQNDAGGAQTWLPGLCRNAAEHCLSSASQTYCQTKTLSGQVVVSCDGFGVPETTTVTGDREGVVLADFGISQFSDGSDGFKYGTPELCTTTQTDAGAVTTCVNAQTANEALMGTECVDANNSVRIYTCAVDENGVASVQCSGPIQ